MPLGVPPPAPPLPRLIAPRGAKLAPIAPVAFKPPPSHVLPIKGAPTISVSHAVAIMGSTDPLAQQYAQDVAAAAATGDPQAIGDHHLLTLAEAAQIASSYVAKWFGQAQADTLLTLGHLAGGGGAGGGRPVFARAVKR